MKTRFGTGRRARWSALAVLFASTFCVYSLHAQSVAPTDQAGSQPDVQQLSQTVQTLQARMSQLENEQTPQRAAATEPAAYSVADQTLSGRLTCAGLAEHTYACGKDQPIWGCTLQCVSQGSQYVLQTGNKIYPVSGDPAQLQQFAADHVVVTGELTDSGLNIQSITK